jgi:hypothetical protein
LAARALIAGEALGESFVTPSLPPPLEAAPVARLNSSVRNSGEVGQKGLGELLGTHTLTIYSQAVGVYEGGPTQYIQRLPFCCC